MKIIIKGRKIILSNAPVRDVVGAFLIISSKIDGNEVIFDAKAGQKEYWLPDGVDKKDVEALYLRVL